MRLHNILPKDRESMERLFDYINQKPGTKISKEEEGILERCNFADNMLRNRNSDRAVRDMLKKRFSVSDATAYSDIATTKYLFNSLSIADKDYGLKLLLELNMKALDRAMIKDDLKVADSLMNTRLKLLEKIAQDDGDDSRRSLQPSVFLMQLPSHAGRPKIMNMNDFHTLDEHEIEEIEEKVNKAMIPIDLPNSLKR
jgi:hypothetical protein